MISKVVILMTLSSAKRKMSDDHCQGVRPKYRPREWEMEERMEVNRKKKISWFQQVGFMAPIIVPPTPKGELAK